MNDLTTRNHSDMMVITADDREAFELDMAEMHAEEMANWEDDGIDYDGEDDFGEYDEFDSDPEMVEAYRTQYADDFGGFDMD